MYFIGGLSNIYINDELIWLDENISEILLLANLIPYSIYLLLLALFLQHYWKSKNSHRHEVYLQIVTICNELDNKIYSGVIDLNDPKGILLRSLYLGVPHARVVTITNRQLPTEWCCIMHDCDGGLSEWQSFYGFIAYNSPNFYPEILDGITKIWFSSPNSQIWEQLINTINLTIKTGPRNNTTIVRFTREDYIKVISPNSLYCTFSIIVN